MRKKRKQETKKNILLLAVILIIVLIISLIIYKHPTKETKTTTKESNQNQIIQNEEKRKIDENISEEEDKKNQEKAETTEQTYITQSGDEEVKVEANKVVSATGFAGANNYKFYLRGTTLYFRNISSSDTEEEILAYNVKDVYLENKEVVAELYSDGKIVKENNYITYK